MQAADGIDGPAAANGEVRHIEALGGVLRVLPPEREQALHGNPELSAGVLAQMGRHQIRRKAVETCRHSGMSGEQIPRTRRG